MSISTPSSGPAGGALRGPSPALFGFVAAIVLIVLVCAALHRPPDRFDPLAQALAAKGTLQNKEAPIPPMCYTKTGGVSNPCYPCHVEPVAPNQREDWTLQEEYAFSEYALVNRWHNLFKDRSREIAAIDDAEILSWIRQDNYQPLRETMATLPSTYIGWRPDLDFRAGFDDEGFARDGSGWRAVRFKPFPGTFWPTNGSTDDVMIRLPAPMRPDRAIYRLNLAILEAAIAAPPGAERAVEPVDESLAKFDLDGDGKIGGLVTRIRRLPPTFGGTDVVVTARLYPAGVEFLHTVRYLDPDAPTLLSARMKEVRYSRKLKFFDQDAITRSYTHEFDDKMRGFLPYFVGEAATGFRNKFGWILQGWIEDARGRLRVQTGEEQLFCMGCHNSLGVTVDQTFAFPRKVPGPGGWRPQDLRGMADAPQAGQADPEALTYFRRVGGADELRANDEMLAKHWPGGKLDETSVRAARDLAELLTPSRARALTLNKAYLAVVREQTFLHGRDPIVRPAVNVHREIRNGATENGDTGRIFKDGRLWLDWTSREASATIPTR